MPDSCRATAEDLPRIVEFKLRMFSEAGRSHLLAPRAEQLIASDYQTMYAGGTAAHFLVRDNGAVVGCAGGFLKDDIPYRYFTKAIYGFIGDVYVVPEARGRGLARGLSLEVIDWLRQCGVQSIRLLASEAARPIYASLGFRNTDEMALHLSST